MKTVPKYELKGDKVEAYEKADIESLAYAFKEAYDVWVQEWERQGACVASLKDEGSCVAGNGLTVWYSAPGKRTAKPLIVVRPPPTQGCVSQETTMDAAITYLRDRHDINVEYTPGRMD